MVLKHGGEIRILYVAPYPPLKNGIATYSFHFLKAFENCTDVKFTLFSDPMDEVGRSHVIHIFKESQRLIKLNSAEKYDILHFETGGSLLREFLLILSLSKMVDSPPIVITVHDPPKLVDLGFFIRFVFHLPSRLFLNRLLHRLTQKFFSPLEKFVYEQTSFVFTFANRGAASLIEKFGKRNLQVIPLGILDDWHGRTESFQKKERFVILFFGFITKGKGLETLIQAIHQMIRMDGTLRVKMRVWIVGDTAFRKDERYVGKLKKRVSSLGLDDVLEFKQRVPEELIQELFDSSDLLVLPYDPLDRFSSSAVLIRGMSYGLPVIVSNTRGFPDEIQEGKTGLFFESGNPRDLAEKILLLWSDGDLRKKLGENAKAHIEEEHNWKRISEMVFQQYRRIILRHELHG